MAVPARVGWAFLCMAACGSSGNHPGPPPCAGPDADGDGVCDAVDDCPDVYDPGQVDLDGDGKGWVCDAVERVPIAHGTLQSTVSLTGSLHGQTLAAGLGLGCSAPGACVGEVVTASPMGGGTVRSDSAGSGDEWFGGRLIDAALVTEDEHIFLHIYQPNVVGNFDPATRMFRGIKAELMRGYGIAGDSFAIAELEKSDGTLDLVIPSGADLMSVGGIGRAFDGPVIAPLPSAGTPPTFAIPSQDSAGVYLAAFTAGDSAPVGMVTPQGATASDFRRLDDGHPLHYSEVPFCGAGMVVEYIGVAKLGTAAVLPFINCNVVTPALDTVTGETLFLVGEEPSTKRGIVALRHHQLTTVATGLDIIGGVNVTGGDVPVIASVAGNGTAITWNASVLGSAGAVSLTTSPLGGLQASVHGSTAHVVGMALGSNGFANLVLVRYRDGQPVQQVTLATQQFQTDTPQVVTTAEGGAIVTSEQQSWAVPSTSLTATPLNLTGVVGGVRGTTTVVRGSQGSSSQLYTYDETGGTPRLIPLTPATTSNVTLVMVDPPEGPPSTWFAYSSGGACKLAQIGSSGGVPVVQNEVPCEDPLAIKAWGRTPDGKLLVWAEGAANAYTAYLLDDAGATEVADATGAQPLDTAGAILDTSVWPSVVVGWYGGSASGGFACLARHPDRCWSVPTSVPVTLSARSSGADDADSFALGWYPAGIGSDAASEAVFLHAVGSGDRPPPL